MKLTKVVFVLALLVGVLSFSALTSSQVHASSKIQVASNVHRLQSQAIPQSPKLPLSCARVISHTRIYNSQSGVPIGELWLYFYIPPCTYWQGLLERYADDGTGYDSIEICKGVCYISSDHNDGLGATYLSSSTIIGTGSACVYGTIYDNQFYTLGSASVCNSD